MPRLADRLRGFVLPQWDVKKFAAAVREVESLALAIDMLRRGESSAALDHLCRRAAGVWMGVETGNWALAGSLAGHMRSAVACLPSDVQVSLARTMRMQQHLGGASRYPRGQQPQGGADGRRGATDGEAATVPTERRGRRPYYGAQSGAQAQGARASGAVSAAAGSQQA
jgi:hypothetical protein